LRAADYGSGIANIDLFAYVHCVLPVPWFRYSAVKVSLTPGVKPLRIAVAVARCSADPARISAVASEAAVRTRAPADTNDIKQDVELELPCIWDVTETSTTPEAGTVTVTKGPGDPAKGP
jgi:hypothetical protein